MNYTNAFVVGNGVSRRPIDLHGLKGKGSIYGCNALYRTFADYDYLVAIDDGIIKELKENCVERVIIPPEEERWESMEYSTRRRRSNAGMNAMLEAIRNGCDKLYCLGFDFLLKGEISVDNVFKNTKNYGVETKAVMSDNVSRIRYLEWFMNKHSNIKFCFVLPDECEFAQLNANNVTGIFVSNFREEFGC